MSTSSKGLKDDAGQVMNVSVDCLFVVYRGCGAKRGKRGLRTDKCRTT